MTNINTEHWWQPFTNTRGFRENPRMFSRAEGCFLYTDDGRDVLDITACLWCMNLGHGRKEIAAAVKEQVETLDFAPGFSFGHEQAFRFAERLCQHTPEGMNRVFFTNDGSGSIDTAIKLARQYHLARGNAGKTRLVSRELGYHGINIGGTSIQGIANNRKGYPVLEEVDFLPSIFDIESNAFTRGLPTGGVEKAEALEGIVAERGADNIAAVIVEPIVGASGMVPPSLEYLQRLRDLCTKHDILLIFDEVVTGFGRTGAAFAANKLGVIPDLITCAKGITAGTIPMGAVIIRDDIQQTILDAAPAGTVELFHGTTYAGHPIAAAAGNACLDLYENEGLFERASGEIAEYWEDALHSLRDIDALIDIRNYGLLGGITFAARPEQFPAGVGAAVHARCFENGLLCRGVGDHMVMSPPLTISKQEIDLFIERLRKSIAEVL